jgi:aspartate aminotransferase-like enzyme
MTPPGLGLAAVSEAALSATGSSPRFYFDWARTRKAQEKLDAPVTLPVSLVSGLDVALDLLLAEGLEAAFDRHTRLGRAARAGVKALGLELFSPDEDRSAVVTAVRAPAGIDSGDVIRGVRDRFGITIANGQGELKGRSSASATSAGSTSSTSRPRSRRSSSSSPISARTSSAGSR